MGTRDKCVAAGRSPDGHDLCKNGFPTNGACFGTIGTPICLQEKLCGRLFAHNGGRPIPPAQWIPLAEVGK